MKVTINLLPSIKKEEIRIQQLAGMVFKIGFSAFSAISIFIIFLLSCIFIINIQEEIIVLEKNQLQKVDVYSEIQATYNIVEEYHEKTQQISKGLSDQISHVEILEKINDLIPENLFLQEVSINENEVIVKGFSSNRDFLIDFREKLEKEEYFESVEAPISNFTVSEDINFVFTIGIKK